MYRRDFVGILSAACAAELLRGNITGVLAAQTPHISFPTDPHSRIAVSAWAFRSIIDAPANDERDPRLQSMDMKDFAAHVREKFNVTNIEPYNRYFRSLEPAYLDEFVTSSKKAAPTLSTSPPTSTSATTMPILKRAPKPSPRPKSGLMSPSPSARLAFALPCQLPRIHPQTSTAPPKV